MECDIALLTGEARYRCIACAAPGALYCTRCPRCWALHSGSGPLRGASAACWRRLEGPAGFRSAPWCLPYSPSLLRPIACLPGHLPARRACLAAVEDESFWQGLEAVHFGGLPLLQDSVTVIGWVAPLGRRPHSLPATPSRGGAVWPPLVGVCVGICWHGRGGAWTGVVACGWWWQRPCLRRCPPADLSMVLPLVLQVPNRRRHHVCDFGGGQPH